MLILITYDIKTDSVGGPRRLRRISKACLDYGQRVQYSVFECEINPVQWTELRARLLSIYNEQIDSLRFYRLGANFKHKIEHCGAKPAVDFDGILII